MILINRNSCFVEFLWCCVPCIAVKSYFVEETESLLMKFLWQRCVFRKWCWACPLPREEKNITSVKWTKWLRTASGLELLLSSGSLEASFRQNCLRDRLFPLESFAVYMHLPCLASAFQLQDSFTSCCLVQTFSSKRCCFCPPLSLIFFRGISFCLNAARGQNSNWDEPGGSCAFYATSTLQLQGPVAGELCPSCPA